MEAFCALAASNTAELRQALMDAREKFRGLVEFYQFKSKASNGTVTTQDFFEIWALFFDSFGECWKSELRALARRRFEAAQQSQRAQKELAKTKKVICGGRVLFHFFNLIYFLRLFYF